MAARCRKRVVGELGQRRHHRHRRHRHQCHHLLNVFAVAVASENLSPILCEIHKIQRKSMLKMQTIFIAILAAFGRQNAMKSTCELHAVGNCCMQIRLKNLVEFTDLQL